MDKYEEYYSQKDVSELLSQIHKHRAYGNRIDKKWYDALLIHMQSRYLSVEEKELLEYVLNSDPEKLLAEITEEDKQNNTRDSNNSQIEYGIDASLISRAGKNIKNIIYTNLIMIAVIIVAALMISSSDNINTIRNIYIFAGITSLCCNIVIMIQLFNAGDNLENSSYIK